MGYEWMASGVYAITNKVTGEQYIGCGKMFCLRWLGHVTNLDRGVHHSRKLQQAWNEYGKDAFDFGILEVVPGNSTKALRDRERAWITDTNPAYNTVRLGSRVQELVICSETGVSIKWETLQEAREAQNLSLTELARLSGVDMSDLSRIEHGMRAPSARIIQAVTAALKCTPEELGWDKYAARSIPSLRTWRIRRLMHQGELAKAAGVSLSTVQGAEYGKLIRPALIHKLAKALDVTPEQLCSQKFADALDITYGELCGDVAVETVTA